MALSALEVISTEDESVHIRASDGERPVNIYVERSDIDNYLKISDNDARFKRDFIRQNIDAIKMMAYSRYRKGLYEEGSPEGTDAVRIALTLADLQSMSLIVPPRQTR